MEQVKITLIANGPAKIEGPVKFMHSDGKEEVKDGSYICRCRKSKNYPWCDGSHAKE